MICKDWAFRVLYSGFSFLTMGQRSALVNEGDGFSCLLPRPDPFFQRCVVYLPVQLFCTEKFRFLPASGIKPICNFTVDLDHGIIVT